MYIKDFQKENGNYMGYSLHVVFFKNIPIKNIYPLAKAKFDDSNFMVPRNYKEYLILEFGDYMVLPPEEKRIAHNLELMPILHNSTKNVNSQNIDICM